MVLLGVLGRYETDPESIQISDKLFMAALAVVGFGPGVTILFLALFGFQFLRVITRCLQEMEKQSAHAEGAADNTAQIKLIISKVTLLPAPLDGCCPSCFLSFSFSSFCPSSAPTNLGPFFRCRSFDGSPELPHGVLQRVLHQPRLLPGFHGLVCLHRGLPVCSWGAVEREAVRFFSVVVVVVVVDLVLSLFSCLIIPSESSVLTVK